MNELLERVLVVGAGGQLGSALMREFAPFEPVGPAHAELDLTDGAALETALVRLRPTLIINTAAFHNVEACEAQPGAAFGLNALAVDALAGACARAGSAFAQIGTDYVFGGERNEPYDEGDAARPLNVYGASKLAGEALLQRHGERWFVFRTSALFGPGGRSGKGPHFVERMLSAAERREPLRVVDDVRMSPSYAPHVARAIGEIVARGRFGLYHLTNAGECSWHELASESLRLGGFERRVEAVRTQRPAGSARRPMYSVLAPGELRRAALAELPPWRDAVGEYVATRARVRDAV